MQEFLGTAQGLSRDYYGGIHKLLRGTGKGNVFLGSMCRDVLCFAFKEMKKKRLGIIITSKSNHKEVQIFVTALVDDAYFCTSRV